MKYIVVLQELCAINSTINHSSINRKYIFKILFSLTKCKIWNTNRTIHLKYWYTKAWFTPNSNAIGRTQIFFFEGFYFQENFIWKTTQILYNDRQAQFSHRPLHSTHHDSQAQDRNKRYFECAQPWRQQDRELECLVWIIPVAVSSSYPLIPQ